MITATAHPPPTLSLLKQPTRSDAFLYVLVTPQTLHNTIYRNVMQM